MNSVHQITFFDGSPEGKKIFLNNRFTFRMKLMLLFAKVGERSTKSFEASLIGEIKVSLLLTPKMPSKMRFKLIINGNIDEKCSMKKK